MGLLIESVFLELLGLISLLCWSLYWYITKNYDYWEKRGVPYNKPIFPFGSLKEIILLKTFVGKAHDNIYKTFPKERFYGVIDFRKPALVLKDPDLIKKVMVKDFQHFVDRPIFMGNPKEYIVLHLLNLTGKEWKDMRAKLTPTFTSGKLKLMFDLMERCSEALKEKLEREVDDYKTIDAKDILARFTMDIIASCAFGLEANNLAKDEKGDSEFYRMFRGVATTTKLRYARRLVILVFPYVMRLLRINLVRPPLREFVTNIVRDTIEYRQKNNVKRNDFLDLLINIKHNKGDWGENNHTNNESKSNGSVTEETLRLYGSAHSLSRVCTEPYRVPDSDLVVERGTRVVIPLFALHHDPQYYPDPYEFKPERFAPEEFQKRHPFVFMPFGEGPRNCIGMRFGLMQAKVGLSTVILNFQVHLSSKQEVPIEIDKRSAPLMPANPVLLNFTKRKS